MEPHTWTFVFMTGTNTATSTIRLHIISIAQSRPVPALYRHHIPSIALLREDHYQPSTVIVFLAFTLRPLITSPLPPFFSLHIPSIAIAQSRPLPALYRHFF
jgi:hypothetical protein